MVAVALGEPASTSLDGLASFASLAGGGGRAASLAGDLLKLGRKSDDTDSQLLGLLEETWTETHGGREEPEEPDAELLPLPELDELPLLELMAVP